MSRPGAFVCLAMALALAACGSEREKEAESSDPRVRLAKALDPCADRESKFAQAMCADQRLADLSGAIRETMIAEAAEVSAPGAQLLLDNQQRWLRAQRIACGMADPDAAPTPEQRACLEALLRQRARDASSAVERIGGYTFQRVEIVEAEPVTAEAAAASGLGDDAPKAIIKEIRFPRIDDASPQAARFNALVAQQPQFGVEDQTEEQVTYAIAYAGPELVSVRFDTFDYTLGAAHPNNGVRAVTVVMTTGQPLAAADVFRPGSGWENFLTRRAMTELTRQFREASFTPPRADVRDAVAKPHLWLVKEQGLVLLFPPYSFGGPFALGGAEVTIPWADLARYLNPNAPAPIRAPA